MDGPYSFIARGAIGAHKGAPYSAWRLILPTNSRGAIYRARLYLHGSAKSSVAQHGGPEGPPYMGLLESTTHMEQP